jgi:hypothetical protein
MILRIIVQKYFVKGMSMVVKRRLNLVLSIAAFATMLISVSLPQEGQVNRKKIEREQSIKQKEAKKQYKDAVKRHSNLQTKETRSRMKQTKRNSKNATPIRH